MSDGTPLPPPPPPPGGGYGAPPPPPGGGYGAPPPFGAPGAAPQNGMGTAALVMGILQFICLGPIGSILAIIFGVIGNKKAKQGLATNGGMAKAGLWLGVIGLVLAVISLILMVVLGVGIFKAAEASLDPANNAKTGLADGSYYMDPTASVRVNDRCSFTGIPVTAETDEVLPTAVTVVGVGPSQCGTGNATVTEIGFTVSGGTAAIEYVE